MKIAPVLLIMLSTIACVAQNGDRSDLKVSDLPDELSESSGLIVEAPNMFWSINDSGNDPELIAFDSNGKVMYSRNVKGAKNTDWETLAQKGDTFFIGDVGNNRNKRKDLSFYLANKNGKMLQKLPFRYPDQKQFPPSSGNMNFDMEASFYKGGYLYMFSKTRLPERRYTKIYKLPVNPSKKEVEANLLDSLNIKTMITGATLSPIGNVLLMSYGRIYSLSEFEFHDWEGTKIDTIAITVSQTEAIDCLGSDIFYYTDEQGNLFKQSLKAFE